MPRAPTTISPRHKKEQHHEPLHVEMDQDERIAKYGRIVPSSKSTTGKLRRKTSRSRMMGSDQSESEEEEGEVCVSQRTSSLLWDTESMEIAVLGS